MIEIIVIIIIVVFQIAIAGYNLFNIKKFRSIFPEKNPELYCNKDKNINIISKPKESGKIFSIILDTINKYLETNKSSASDFHLIKDIVDRNCDSLEEEINTQTPMPLYLGLIGTMFGILIGISGIDLNTFDSENIKISDSGIQDLFRGVSIAMISSIIGIVLTTISSFIMKTAISEVNTDKNSFFSWFQISLLPKLSDGAISVVFALEQNMAKFNSIFSSNIGDMKESIELIHSSFDTQFQVLQKIEQINVRQLATANIKVLTELQKSTTEFEKFNQYIHDVTDYMNSINKLNETIDNQYERTKAIEKMGEFFQDEINQIDERKAYLKKTVGDIDDAVKTAIDKLGESANKHADIFIQNSVLLHEKFNEVANKQSEMLQNSLKDTSALVKELQNLKDVKSTMSNVEKSAKEQNNKLDKLINAINNLNIGGTMNANPSSNKWLKIPLILTCSIISLCALIWLSTEGIELIIETFNKLFPSK